MILSTRDMAVATGGDLLQDAPAGPIHTDTRTLTEGAWFLALRGENFDGHAFLDTAAAAGCAGVVVDTPPAHWERGVLVVQDTLRALQDCAAAVRDTVDGPVIAVTGSAGKTTTRAMIESVLQSVGPVHATAGNFNNHVGLPLTLLAMPTDARVLVLEMGMSAPGEIQRLQEIARPNVRLITNVSLAHTEGLGDLAGVAACKQELFDGASPLDLLVVNADDPWVSAMPRPKETRLLLYGSSQGCDARLLDAYVDPQSFATRATFELPSQVIEVELAAPGRHVALDACAAAGVAHALGVDPLSIVRGLASWAPVGMRMQVERLADGVVVLNDAYNANPASTAAALQALSASGGSRHIALLGDMLELGSAESKAHEDVIRQASALGLALLGLVGPRYGDHVGLARELHGPEVLVAEDSASLGELLKGRLQSGDVVLLKGSRGMRMERVLDRLRQGAP
jgi:UDP-N-acetylmuramoyl-tripeptide--D-alanyl-D-alanine ligase